MATDIPAMHVSSSTIRAAARVNPMTARTQPNAHSLREGTWEKVTERKTAAVSSAMGVCKKSAVIGRPRRSIPLDTSRTNEAARSVRYSHGHARKFRGMTQRVGRRVDRGQSPVTIKKIPARKSARPIDARSGSERLDVVTGWRGRQMSSGESRAVL
jgi:hypothetical protein